MTIKKVLIQLNQLGYGGTEKGILTFTQLMDRSKFDPYLFYLDRRGSAKYYRLKLLSPLIKSQAQRFKTMYVERFSREDAFRKTFSAEKVYHGDKKEFLSAIEKIQPDIIHLNRGDETDYYTDFIPHLPKKIKVVESSIFGKNGPADYVHRLDQVYFLSRWLENKSPWAQGKSRVLYLPALAPKTDQNLRQELQIPPDFLVIGRASRPDLDHDNFLEKVYSLIPADISKKVIFLCLGSKPKYSDEFLQKFGSQVKVLSATTDETRVSKFYNTLDIFSHRRPEGETFGLVIAEAMLHGVPVITHLSDVDNAQAEVLGNDEYVSAFQDHTYYASRLTRLLENPELRKSLGKSQADRAQAQFSAAKLTKDLQSYYSDLF